jgi:hypothetical protein
MHAQLHSVHALEWEKAGFLWLWGRKKLVRPVVLFRWINLIQHPMAVISASITLLEIPSRALREPPSR